MGTPVQILHLEDNPLDAELSRDFLDRAGLSFELQVVADQASYEQCLGRARYDLILSDFSLPGYDGMAALACARMKQPDVPFILISGTLGEEQAVDCMLEGATDYVLKQRLERLAPAVRRALAEADEHRARRRAEDALQESEAEFRAMFEMAPVGMAQADPQTGRYLRVNPKYCEITGYSESELLTKRVSETVHHDERELDREFFDRVVRGELPAGHAERRYLRKDGSVAWVSVNLTVIRDAAGRPARTMAAVEDITGRKHAEEERARLVAAIEQAAESVVITDTQGRILYVNPAFERTSGYSREEVLGLNPRVLRSGSHDAEFFRKLWDRLARGEVWQGNFINRRKDGTLYEESATISPVRDAAGRTVNYVAIKLDVTRVKQLEAHFQRAQKLEAFGQLAGGIAHDFNNLLAAFILNIGILRLNPTLDAETDQGLKELDDLAHRSASLTRQLLMFSRRSVLALRPQDLNAIVGDLLKMLSRLIGEHIELRFEGAGDLPSVEADASMMEQVLMNLVVNSRDAMPDGGSITIQTTEECIDAAEAAPSSGRLPGRFVCLRVADTGAGMDQETLKHIFEPFFTTKEVGKGTGLGLATVHGIVAQHKGWVEVKSAPGQGTTFKVYLPALGETSTVAKPEFNGDAGPHGHETILVVEDDEGVRRPVAESLRLLGYSVLEADSGTAAMEVWHDHGSRVSLLLTDMVMPGGMTGLELAKRFQVRKPDLKIILSSGYSMQLAQIQDTGEAGCAYLSKPYRMRQLAQLVRDSLDRST